MGYRIEYNMQSITVKQTSGKKLNYRKLLLIIGLVLSGICLHFGCALLENWIFGRGSSAVSAADVMVSKIKEGATLPEAVQVFCYEVFR